VPVVATAVGGLSEAVTDDVDGILCAPEDVAGLAEAIERIASEHPRLSAGVRSARDQSSFRRYGQLICEALESLPARASRSR
jgi:glycosyltransferase involved in cell wall biosynthesis